MIKEEVRGNEREEEEGSCIESGMSPGGHQIYPNGKRGMNTVEEVGRRSRTKSPTR